MVRMTTRPRAAHCRKYSTRDNVSNISMPLVGWSSNTRLVSRSRRALVEAPPLRHRQPADAGVAYPLQSEIHNQRIDLQNVSDLNIGKRIVLSIGMTRSSI